MVKNKVNRTKGYDVQANGKGINVFTHVDFENSEYKLFNPRQEVSGTVQTEFLKYFERLEKDDIVSITGSFSQGIDPKILFKIAQTVQEKQAKLVVDTSYRCLYW